MRKKLGTDIPPYTNAIDTAAQMQRYISESEESIAINTRHRDDAIYSAYGSGRSIREIGRRIGISHTQVKNIVDRCIASGRAPHPDNRWEPSEPSE
jgi:Mor family transcriptional regulator